MKKSNVFKSLAVAVTLLFSANAANAQLEQSAYINFGLPTGEFNAAAETNIESGLYGKYNYAKDVTLGLGLGYRAGFIFDVGVGQVTPFFNADLFWNRTNKDVREEYAQKGYKIPNYINLPLMIGANYRYELTDVVTLFGEFGIGYDLLLASAEGKKGDGVYYHSYKTGGAMAWQIGVGSYFGNHVSLGLHYYGLGSHTIAYRSASVLSASEELEDVENNKNNDLRSMGTVALRLGFHF